MDKLTLKSYAKLNLYLKVLHKRKDNYHNIITLFERVDLSDRIILKVRLDGKIRVKCDKAGVPLGKSNLCYRSAKLLQDCFKVNRGVDIQIEKSIPLAAGLAGGSSNAAATLLGLQRLWGLRVGIKRLMRLAAQLGSDVPFLISNTPFAQGSRRGEKIRPIRALRRLRLWHILIVPDLQVSTPLIYKRWDSFSAEKNKKPSLTEEENNVKILCLKLKKKDLRLIKEGLFNSLEDVTLRFYPQVKKAKEALSNIGLEAILMSGSGPAVFGVVASRKEAMEAKRRLEREGEFHQVFVVSTI